MNPYKLLQIDADADQQTIKTAYHSLSKTLHPDLNKGREDDFIELNKA